MENHEENDRIEFEHKWMKIKLDSYAQATHEAEEFIVINLQTPQGSGRISKKIRQVRTGIHALNRSAYFLYINNPIMLFDYFKRNGLLHNQKEWNNLQQAMILDFLRYLLAVLYKENCHLENLSPMETMILIADDLAYAGLRDCDRETLTHHRQHLLPSNDWAPIVFDPVTAPSMECPLSQEKLYTGLTLVNDKYHIFSPKTSIEDVFNKIICPNWTNNRVEVHLYNKTNMFRCLVDCIKLTYKHFNYAHIGHSGLFFSMNGVVINESSLSSAILKNEEKKQCIESFFK